MMLSLWSEIICIRNVELLVQAILLEYCFELYTYFFVFSICHNKTLIESLLLHFFPGVFTCNLLLKCLFEL